jgi:hypothetical protein
LEQAGQQALREAVLVLVMELSGRIESEKSWLSRWAQTLPGGGFLTRDIFPGARDPRRKWLEALRRAVSSDRFKNLHHFLKLSDHNLRQCFAEGDVCQALGSALADTLLEWARFELRGHEEHPDFVPLVREGLAHPPRSRGERHRGGSRVQGPRRKGRLL